MKTAAVLPSYAPSREGEVPTRAVIYCRISDDRNDGWGVKDQEARCLGLLKQMRWQLVQVNGKNALVDNDISASRYSKKKRPAWEQLLLILELGQADAIVAIETARLIRQPKDLIQLQEAAPKVKIKTGDEFIDMAKGLGSFMAGIKALIDAEESDKMARRIRRRKESDAREGRPQLGGRRVFGYEGVKKNDEGIIVNRGRINTVVIAEEAALVREAAQRVLTGDGLKTIATDWNERGVATVTGTRWSDVVIKQMLTRPHVAGYRNHPRVGMVRGAWEPIIDKGTYDKLQRALRPRRQQRPVGYRYILTGLLHCWKCDGTLVGKLHKGTNRYMCNPSMDGLRRCYAVSRSAAPIEEYVIEETLTYLEKHPPLVHQSDENSELESQLCQALDTYRADLDELALDYYERHLVTRELFQRTATNLNERISTVEERLAELSTSRAFLAISDNNIRETWERLTSFEWRRNLLRSAIERIEVRPVGKEACRRPFDPGAIVIKWAG